jgi:hypothetical protein
MEKNEKKLEIQIDEATAQGIYSNLGIINHTDSEFTIDFIFIQPQSPQGKVRARIITSPRHATRLLIALEENVRRYEANFGVIEPAPAGHEPAHIQ